MNNLLKLQDLSKDEILDIIEIADKLKFERKQNYTHNYLEGMTLGMVFRKSSTRTRVSFETGMYQLGGQALFLSNNDLQVGRGESIEDTARVLSRYLDCIMIRTYSQKEVEDIANYGTVPVINGLTDYCHPCQVLADLMTIKEYKKKFSGLKLCYIGDGNNMANSLIVGTIKLGMKCSIACPDTNKPDANLIKWAEENGDFECCDDILKCAKDSDVLYTDVWASMGQESEVNERKVLFEGFQINDDVLSVAKKDVILQHCLPAHKGEEITKEAFEEHAKEIFDEAENRLHAQKAVLLKLLSPAFK